MKRVNDISHQVAIIGAVGDSISAGVGATALNIIDVFNEVKHCTAASHEATVFFKKGSRGFFCDGRRGQLVFNLEPGKHPQTVQPGTGGFILLPLLNFSIMKWIG